MAHPGLSDATRGLVSIRALNVAAHFVRHQNGELRIDEFPGGGNAALAADATFRVEALKENNDNNLASSQAAVSVALLAPAIALAVALP